MATISKHGDRWRAQIQRRGVRKSKIFALKREAQDWANEQEAAILGGAKVAARMTFGDLLARYGAEVSPTKRGEQWEVIRLAKIARDRIGAVQLGDLSAADFADWRDRRLREVAPSSVRREMNLLGSVLSVARDEWGVIGASPMKGVRKPKEPPSRERLVTQDELDRMAYVAGDDLKRASARAYAAFLFAIETAMRAGEIVGLTSASVDVDQRVAQLAMTKNGRARAVPLSARAIEIWQSLPSDDFALSSRQLDALFRRVRDRAMVDDLVFHDSRHTAITRLAQKLHPMDLARMVGHTDLKMLLRYYDESAADIAKRLG
ncbi:tyrosine-type recombinase/integrase [Pseudooceanicola sp. MF1-13]|uniref:tyrosine-type recombinase/integrase n=1 Tax=Pseudooceanicola sp. MF1-13 TaxID=3379095 RepID=UPI003891421D